MNSTPDPTPAATGTTPLFVPYDAVKHPPGFWWVRTDDSLLMAVSLDYDGYMHAATRGRSLHGWLPSNRFLFGPRIPSPEELDASAAEVIRLTEQLAAAHKDESYRAKINALCQVIREAAMGVFPEDVPLHPFYVMPPFMPGVEVIKFALILDSAFLADAFIQRFGSVSALRAIHFTPPPRCPLPPGLRRGLRHLPRAQ